MTLAEEVAALQVQLRIARERQVRAAVASERAEQDYEHIRQELRRTFGVVNADEAAAKLSELRAELTRVMDGLRQALEAADE